MVWTLDVLFNGPFAEQLVFKGGTSLSKAYQVIRRFSEDIDITYDIRAIAPDLVGDSPEPLPPSRSQEKRWTREIRSRLSDWVSRTALPLIEAALGSQRLTARPQVDGDKIVIDYEPLATGSGYVAATWKGKEEDVVGCKWSLAIPGAVHASVRRPGAIEHAIAAISKKGLNERLRKLERFGILEKFSCPEVPP